MEKSDSGKQQQAPFDMEATAPLPSGAYSFRYAERAPPPTYEESQKSYGVSSQNPRSARPLPPQYFNTMQPTMPLSAQGYSYSAFAPHLYRPFVMTPVGAVPDTSSPADPTRCTLAKGAEILYTPTGAVSIPPPPPGCAPNAAQLAAMQGQPVLLQKKKRSFF